MVITVSPRLLAQLEALTDGFAKGLEAIHARGRYLQSPDKALAAGEAFDKFRDAMDDLAKPHAMDNLLKSTDPKKQFTFFARDASGQNYYRLRCGEWDAFYFVSLIGEQNTAIALLVLHNSTSSQAGILAELETELAYYRQSHG